MGVEILACSCKHSKVVIWLVFRWQLSPSVLWGLCGIIQGEVGKWGAEGAGQPAISSLKVVSGALCCLRNALPNCARNQLMVRLPQVLPLGFKDNVAPRAAHSDAFGSQQIFIKVSTKEKSHVL